MNPVPYRASYFGEKLHFDHNEKLNMYGVVHVLAVDGYSRKIVGFITPRKNPIAIYGYLFRPVLSRCGIWRTDHRDRICSHIDSTAMYRTPAFC